MYPCNFCLLLFSNEYVCAHKNLRYVKTISAMKFNLSERECLLTCIKAYLLENLAIYCSPQFYRSIKVWDLRKSYTSLVTLPTPLQCFTYPGTIGRRPGSELLCLISG